MTSRRSDSTRLFLSRKNQLTLSVPGQGQLLPPTPASSSAAILSHGTSGPGIWSTNTSLGHSNHKQNNGSKQKQNGAQEQACDYQPLFPYMTTQRPLIAAPRPQPIMGNGSSFLSLSGKNQCQPSGHHHHHQSHSQPHHHPGHLGHHQLPPGFRSPESINCNNSAYNVDTATHLRRESSLSSDLSSKLSESQHIYCHIYESTSGLGTPTGPSGHGLCSCPSCDAVCDLNGQSVKSNHHHLSSGFYGQGNFYDTTSTMTTCVPPMPSSAPCPASRIGSPPFSSTQHDAFPYQLKSKTNNMYIRADDSPKKSNKHKMLGAMGMPGSLDPTPGGHHMGPLMMGRHMGKQGPANRRCLLVSLALAFVVVIGLALMTSFIVFLSTASSSLLTTHQSPLAAQSCACGGGDGANCNNTRPCASDAEVCIVQADNVSLCLAISDPDDPRGCGGHCSGPGQLCRPLAGRASVYQCIEEHPDEGSCLEEGEWRCADTFCIPSEKRCDGHFNCFDRSDEFNCDNCPVAAGEWFHCGNETSCLPADKRCNGFVDCWDGSDEHLCHF
ncbi:Low-density lipoprotein receptor-related protein 6 [Halotydeus destructor]|nr:Low-density lipoprotein receptor-related protein 6 [Halotydeus destructor]